MTDWDNEVDVVVLGSGGAGSDGRPGRRGQRRIGGGLREGRDGRRNHRGVRRHRVDPRAPAFARRRTDGGRCAALPRGAVAGRDGPRTGRDVRAHRPEDARLRRGAQRAAVRNRRGVPGLQARTAGRTADGRSLAERQAVRPVPAGRMARQNHVVPRRLQQCRHRRRDPRQDPRRRSTTTPATTAWRAPR